MSEVGSLIIRLQAETAQFNDDMGKVKSQLDGLKDKSRDAGSGMKASMYEARGGLMLVEESLGVRLPRHLNSLIATIPGVGQAFAMMLPIAGVVVAIEIIGKLIQHHEALANAIHKAAAESVNQAVKEADQGKQLELTNLKLDDQIAKFEHKPAHNYLKEALLETSDAMDKLAATYAADSQKMSDVIDTQTGLWSSLWRGVEDAVSGKGQAKGYGTTTDALNKVQNAMIAVEAARRKMSEAPMTGLDQAAAQQDLIGALNSEKGALDGLLPSLKDDKVLLLQFTSQAASAAAEIKNLKQQQEIGGKKSFLGGHEQSGVNAAMAEADQKQILEVTLASYDKQAAAARLLYQQGIIDASQLVQAETDADNLKYVAHMAYFEKVKALYANDPTKKQSIASEEQVFQMQAYAKATDEAAKGLAEFTQLSAKAVSDQENTLLKDQTADLNKLGKAAGDYAKSLLNLSDSQQKEANSSVTGWREQAQQLQQAINMEKQRAAAVVNDKSLEGMTAYNNALAKSAALQAQLNLLQQQMNPTWKQFMSTMQDNLPTVRSQLQQTISQGIDGFSSSIAKTIVEGKSLGQAMRQVAVQILESWIETTIKRMIFDQMATTMHLVSNAEAMTSDKTTAAASQAAHAKSAAAGAYSALSPIPIVGPALGAVAAVAAYTFLMAFEAGGKIPGQGAVPILGHGGETVVTKALTDRVERAEAHGNTSNHVQMQAHFAPVIHAIDADGVASMLKKHSAVFHREMRSTVRRMNK